MGVNFGNEENFYFPPSIGAAFGVTIVGAQVGTWK
jgi:hypothetical protein